ncbi:MAG: ABC transporter substrate-binding protein [Anderseniella sp.]
MLSLLAAITGPVEAAGKTNASRIVSIGGSVTEIIYMLGSSDKIVAVDSTSVFPATALETKASVGYMRQISPEGVLSTRPDLVVAIEGAGPPQALAVLQESGIAYEKIPNRPSTAGVIEKITHIAELLGKQKQAKQEISRIESDLALLKTAKGSISKQKKVLFLLTAASDRMVAGGTGTSAAGIIELAGGENAITSFAGYKPVSTEAVIAMKPDAILILDRGGHGADPSVISNNPAFSDLPATLNKDIFAMDGSLLLGFGPRVVDAAWMLAERLYPNLERNNPPSEKPAAE